MRSYLVLMLAVVSIGLLVGACQPSNTPIELTQTQIAIQQIAIQNTQAVLEIGVTQTALSRQSFDLQKTALAQTIVAPSSNSVASNAAWTPLEQDVDGVTMVLVPAGCFMMGSTVNAYEKPVHQQCFDAPFWIDKYEVTNAQFATFNGVAAKASKWTGSNRPRESITWFEARDYCAKRGARLPTEREWEYAARGPDALEYPWGRAWNENNAVSSGNSNNQTADVGSRPAGASWVGAQDMSGNVWEWMSSLYQPYPYDAADGREDDTNRTDVLRSLRGGSWDDSGTDYFRAGYRSGGNPHYWYDDGSFRCALLSL